MSGGILLFLTNPCIFVAYTKIYASFDKELCIDLLSLFKGSHTKRLWITVFELLIVCRKPGLCVPVFKMLSFLSFASRRQVLSFHTKAALGYHIHLCSKTPFIFGDEETVISHLTKVTKACRCDKLPVIVIPLDTKAFVDLREIQEMVLACFGQQTVILFLFMNECCFTERSSITVQGNIAWLKFLKTNTFRTFKICRQICPLSFYHPLCSFLPPAAPRYVHLSIYISDIREDLNFV